MSAPFVLSVPSVTARAALPVSHHGHRVRRPSNVLLLGVGRLGAEVAMQMREGPGKLVGIIAKDRGTFDTRGLSGSTVRQLMTYRSSSLPTSRLDFLAYDVILAGLAQLEWPLLVDCTGAEDVERVYAAAGRRGIRVASAAWLAPRDSLQSAAIAMLRGGVLFG